jgi:hypothetical protein
MGPRSNGSTNLANKYWTTVEVNGSDKHSSLLRYDNNYESEMFYNKGPLNKADGKAKICHWLS